MGEKWLYNAPIVVFPLAIFPGGKLTMGEKWLYNTGTQNNGDGPGSNMVIVQLQQRDRVWVRVHYEWHHTGDLLDGPWCTFNGFLLYLAD